MSRRILLNTFSILLSSILILLLFYQFVFATVTLGGSGSSNRSFTLGGTDTTTNLSCSGLRYFDSKFYVPDANSFTCSIGSDSSTVDNRIYFLSIGGRTDGVAGIITGLTGLSHERVDNVNHQPENVSTGTTTTTAFDASVYNPSNGRIFQAGSASDDVITNRNILTQNRVYGTDASFIIYGAYRKSGTVAEDKHYHTTDAMTVYVYDNNYNVRIPDIDPQNYKKDEAISTFTLPDATARVAGRTESIRGPVTIALTGTLPSGLTYNSADNTITGTPDTVGSSTLTYTVTDFFEIQATKTFTINVFDLSIATPTITPSGKAQSKTITTSVTPNTATLTYQFIGGSATCDSSTSGTFDSYPSAGIIANTESRNGQKVCFKGVSGTTTRYLASPVINDIDRTAPTISGISVTSNNSNRSFARRNNTITVSYTASEELKATSPTPSVNLLFPGNITETVNLSKGSGNTYSGTYTLGSNITTDGIINYQTNAVQDLAGNQLAQGSSTATTITVDNTPPSIATETISVRSGARTVNSVNYYNAGDGITVEFTTSEPIKETFISPARIFIGETPTPLDFTGSGTSFSANYRVQNTVQVGGNPESLDGALSIDINRALTDRAGNRVSNPPRGSAIPGHIFDTTRPSVASGPTVTNTGAQTVSSVDYYNAGDTMAISFTLNEEIPADTLTVSFNINTTARSLTFNKGSGANVRDYTATYTVVAGDNATDGQISLNIPELEDIAGNKFDPPVSTLSGHVFDTTPPTAPSIPDLDSVDDSCYKRGSSSSCTFGTEDDDITNNTTGLTFSVTRESQASVEYTFQGGELSSARTHSINRGSSTEAQLDNITLTASEHDYEINATQTDRAGNQSPASATLELRIDTERPVLSTAAATRTFPDLASSYDTGTSNSDDLTNLDEIKFEPYSIFGDLSGSVTNEIWMRAPGSSNHVYVHVVGVHTSNDPSIFVQYLPDDQPALAFSNDGVHNIEFHYVDLAGNKNISPSLDVHYDSTIQEVLVDLKAASDTGASNSDNVTNNTEPTITLSQIESSADPVSGTGKANVTVYNWDGTTSFTTAPDAGELTELFSLTDVASTSTDVQFGTDASSSALAEGIYRLVTKHEDDAGNVKWTRHSNVDDRDSSNHIVIDTTAPTSPSRPDLKDEDDSFGENANGARSGTNKDDITRTTEDLTFLSWASGLGTANETNGGAHDQHQIRFYKWTDINTDDTIDDATELTELKAPSSLVGNKNINTASSSGFEGRDNAQYFSSTNLRTSNARISDLYTTASGDDLSGDGTHSFVAKQYDIAGNLSSSSVVYDLQLDTTAPTPITADLILHPVSDTGTSNEDKETSNVSPIFRARFTQAVISPDIDYFEIERVQLDDSFRAGPNRWLYPSSSSVVQQTSYEYYPDPTFPNGVQIPRDTLQDTYTEAADTYGEGAYSDGVTVEVEAMDVPAFNTWYSFRLNAVDLAGNTTDGVDTNNVRILVPPPTPAKLDLNRSSDTARPGYSAGRSDDITKSTDWNLSGTYRNTAQAEIDNDAADGVTKVEITVKKVDENGVQVGDVVKIEQRRTSDVATSDISISSGSGANSVYRYEFDFNVLDPSSFGPNAEDGRYLISARAFNSAGEGSNDSDTLEIILDREEPTPNDGLTLKSDRIYIDDSYNNRMYFRVSDPDSKELNGAVRVIPTTDDRSVIYNRDSQIFAVGETNYFDGNTRYSETLVGYLANFYDAAGNETGQIDIPLESRAPFITSYVLDEVANRYLVVANTQSDNPDSPDDDVSSALAEPAKQFLRGSDSGRAVCRFNPTGSGLTDYTLTGEVVISTGDQCIGVNDGYGNTAAVHITAEKNDLISNSGLVTAYDHGHHSDDNITNVRNVNYTGRTIAGSNGRIQVKLSTDAWPTDPASTEGIQEFTFSSSGGTIDDAGVITIDVTVEEDGEYNVRGFVENTDVLGASELGPIALESFFVDTVAPSAPTALDLDTADDTSGDAVGLRTDDITSKTRDLTISLTTEAGSKVQLYRDGSIAVGNDAKIFSSTSDSIDIDLPGDGIHQITAAATDVAGNLSERSNPLAITIDTTKPQITILILDDTDGDKTTIDTNTRFIAVASDVSGLGMEVKDSVGSGNCDDAKDTNTIPGGTATYRAGEQHNPAESAHGTCFYAQDYAGNVGTKHSSVSIEGIANLQTTAPGSTIASVRYTKPTNSITWTGVSASGAEAHIHITEDGVAVDANAEATGEATVGQDGTVEIVTEYTFVGGTSYDVYGSITPSGASETPRIKLVDLTIEEGTPDALENLVLNGTTEGTTNAPSGLSLSFDQIDQHKKVTVFDNQTQVCSGNEDRSSATLSTFSCDMSALSDANYLLDYVVEDRAGNQRRETSAIQVTIDQNAPSNLSYVSGTRYVSSEASTINLIIEATSITAVADPDPTGDSTVTSIVRTSGNRFNIQKTYPGGGSDGQQLTTTLVFQDQAGNVTSGTLNLPVYVDTTSPIVDSTSEVDPSDRRHPVFTLGVDFNQGTENAARSETLKIVFGDSCENIPPTASTDITTSTPDASDVKEFTVTLDGPSPGVYSECSFKLVDEAGNESAVEVLDEFIVKSGSGGVGLIGSSLGPTSLSPQVGDSFFKIPTIQPQTVPEATFAPPTFTPISTTPTQFGQSGNDVVEVQKALNQTECQVATEGAGSPGSETSYFGTRTRQAIECVQVLNDLPPTGQLNDQTREILGLETQAQASISSLVDVVVEILQNPNSPIYSAILNILTGQPPVIPSAPSQLPQIELKPFTPAPPVVPQIQLPGLPSTVPSGIGVFPQ